MKAFDPDPNESAAEVSLPMLTEELLARMFGNMKASGVRDEAG